MKNEPEERKSSRKGRRKKGLLREKGAGRKGYLGKREQEEMESSRKEQMERENY